MMLPKLQFSGGLNGQLNASRCGLDTLVTFYPTRCTHFGIYFDAFASAY